MTIYQKELIITKEVFTNMKDKNIINLTEEPYEQNIILPINQIVNIKQKN